MFSGRQAPGGHNVVWGLYEALKVHNAKNTLLGFLGKSCFYPLIGFLVTVTSLFAIKSPLISVLMCAFS